MAEISSKQSERVALSERVTRYIDEVERLVHGGIEHPRCELTRELSLAGAEEKAAFAKLVQGLANANLSEERLLVIGADQRLKQFVPVTNTADFDPARISQLFEKHLDPSPRFEVFPTLQTGDGIPFVLLILEPRQPKPILVKSDVQTSDGRFILRAGEIWVKSDTRLRRATRVDLDLIYREPVEEEAESRARRRFDDLRDQFLASQRFGQFSAPGIPQADLIYGDVQRFRLYVLELIANTDARRFRILLQLLRDLTVEEWHKLDAYSPGGTADFEDFLRKVSEHETDKFLPAIKALVELGILLVKYTAEPQWFEGVVDVLVDVFDSSRRLMRLEGLPVHDKGPVLQLGRLFPAFHAAIGARTLAIFCIHREGYAALSRTLKKFVKNLVPPERSLHPFSYWPVPYSIEMHNGLNLFTWHHGVESFWGEYFGNQEAFLRAAIQLEFLPEFSSWLGVSQEGKDWLTKFRPDLDMAYGPDTAYFSLNAAAPLAQRIYDALQRGPADIILVQLTVEKSLLDARLQITSNDRPLLLLAFLDYLEILQRRTMMRLMRFPSQVDWGPNLGALVKEYRRKKESGLLPPGLPFLPGLS